MRVWFLTLTVLCAACTRSDPQHAPESELPAELAAYRERIESSRLQYVAIEAHRQTGTGLGDSKFLGTPYMPKSFEHPRNPQGQPLVLLAQINLADCPTIPDFPREGILQFYIDGYEAAGHVWGMRLVEGDDEARFQALQDQAHFRVVYFQAVTTDESALHADGPNLQHASLPIANEARLTFSLADGVVKPLDYRFERVLGASWEQVFTTPSAKAARLHSAYARYARSRGIARLGGYAEVAQEDPRRIRPDEDWIVLLEIDSGDGGGANVLWGDAGVANFFIRRDDLRRRDFSRVAYYWDSP